VPAPATVAAAPAPASAPVTATAAVSATPRTYTVQPGDTLADISTLFYGAPEHWRRITTANPAVDPARLSPGTVLSIP
jgi:nucleoid-associated protein YgaU